MAFAPSLNVWGRRTFLACALASAGLQIAPKLQTLYWSPSLRTSLRCYEQRWPPPTPPLPLRPHDLPPSLKCNPLVPRLAASILTEKFFLQSLSFTLRSFVEVLRLIQLHVSHSDTPRSHQPVASCLVRGNRLFTPFTCLWIPAHFHICRYCQICRHCRCYSPREHQQVPNVCTR